MKECGVTPADPSAKGRNPLFATWAFAGIGGQDCVLWHWLPNLCTKSDVLPSLTGATFKSKRIGLLVFHGGVTVMMKFRFLVPGLVTVAVAASGATHSASAEVTGASRVFLGGCAPNSMFRFVLVLARFPSSPALREGMWCHPSRPECQRTQPTFRDLGVCRNRRTGLRPLALAPQSMHQIRCSPLVDRCYIQIEKDWTVSLSWRSYCDDEI